MRPDQRWKKTPKHLTTDLHMVEVSPQLPLGSVNFEMFVVVTNTNSTYFQILFGEGRKKYLSPFLSKILPNWFPIFCMFIPKKKCFHNVSQKQPGFLLPNSLLPNLEGATY